MKKSLLIFALFAIFSNSYAQNDSIRKPIECGTQIIEDEMERENQKIIEDFIAASEKDPEFGNGLWQNIGKQNTDKEILKAGFKRYNIDWEHSDVVSRFEKGNFKYLLLYNNDYQVKRMVLYDKTNFTFLTYDPYFYKNHQHPEVLGKWRPDKLLGANSDFAEFKLKSAINDNKYENRYGYFVEINEDFTFHSYSQGWCGMGCELEIKGTYSFDNKDRIIFSFQEFIYNGEGCEGQEKRKPFVSGPFAFTREENILILKK